MAGLVRRDRLDFIPEQFRKFIEGEWDSPWLRVEEFEEGNEQVVRAELPGLDPEKDVEITVADNMLTIKAEREERAEHKEKSSDRSEFRYGSMVRTVPLAAGTKQEDIRATYRDGVLEVRVRVPEQPAATTTKVPVTRE